MISLLARQINHELNNSYKYQQIAMYLDVKGLKNLAKYYKDWSKEEKEHGIWVQEFLESINVYVDFSGSLEGIVIPDSINGFAELTLATENQTTEMLGECLTQSYKEECCYGKLVTAFIQNKMLQEQIEETEKASTLNDQVKNLGSIGLLQLFDSSFEG